MGKDGPRSENPEDQTTRRLPSSPGPARNIGPYRILQKLGEGGMGEVYEAEQQEPVRRRVAIKLIKAGMDSRQVLARFEAERQALALMNHPGIARIHDAGTTSGGHPYFVMEHVQGEPISKYCDRQRLTLEARIALLRKTCDAVQHAHQKGIIHRDLKPSNILVRVVDNEPVPTIIDFGVAKAISQKLTDKTLFTQMGTLMGTPEYMSPEQAEMTGLDVDTRTDVYSLGVILYELLVGVLPFESKELRQAGFDEIRRRIREDEPSRPSTKVSTLVGKVSDETARRRQATLPVLRRTLKGELDWITMKALEKDRTRRYGSPAELSEDLRRYLENEPVLAGPPSHIYKLQKFVRRHRLAVSAAGLVLLALVLGLSAAVYGLVRARQAEAKALEEADTAKEVTDFLVDAFSASSPWQSTGEEITAREILDRGAERIDEELDASSPVQARLKGTIGTVYADLGLYAEARPLLQEALASQRRMLGDDHPVTLELVNRNAMLEYHQGNLDEAERLLREAAEGRRRVLGDEDRLTLLTLTDLAWVLVERGRFSEAEPLLVETIEVQRRVLDADDTIMLRTLWALGSLYRRDGRRLEEAEKLTKESLDGRRRALGDDHPSTLDSMNSLGIITMRQGRYDEAERILMDVVDIKKRVFGPDHKMTSYSLGNLSELYMRQGRTEEAEPLLKKVVEQRRLQLGEDHKDTLEVMSGLGFLYEQQGRYDESEALLVSTLERWRRVLGNDHDQTVQTMIGLGRLYWKTGRLQEAEDLVKEGAETYRRTLGDENPRTVSARHLLALVYDGQSRYDESESLYTELLDIQQRTLGPRDPATVGLMVRLASMYVRTGSGKAQSWYEDAVEARREVRSQDRGDLRTLDYNLACLAALRGQRDDALRFLQDSVEAGNLSGWMAEDPDLASLHGDPQFEAILADVQARLRQPPGDH